MPLDERPSQRCIFKRMNDEIDYLYCEDAEEHREKLYEKIRNGEAKAYDIYKELSSIGNMEH